MTVADLIKALHDMPSDATVVLCISEMPRGGHFKQIEMTTESAYDVGSQDVGSPENGFVGEECVILWPDFE